MSIIHYSSLTFQTGTVPNKSNAVALLGLPDGWSINTYAYNQFWEWPSSNPPLQVPSPYNVIRDPLYSVPRDYQRASYYSWTQASLNITPFNQTDWPTPRGNSRPDEFYSYSFPLTLIGQDRQFRGPGQWTTYDYPNPQPYPRLNDYTWIQKAQPTSPVVGYIDFRGPVWPLPYAQGWYDFWSLNLLQTTLAPTQAPFSQTDWPLPKTPTQPIQTWLFFSEQLVNLPNPQPFAQSDWPNPSRVVWYKDWSQQTAQPVPQNPFFQTDWPNPLRIIWDRFWSNPIPFGAMQTPFNQLDWPNPKTYIPILQNWTGNLNLLPFVQVNPFVQSDWPLPKTWMPIDQFWKDNPELLLQFLAGTPFVQSDWPVPETPLRIDESFWQALALQLPPPPPPVIPTSAGRWISPQEVISSIARKYGSIGGLASADSRTAAERSLLAAHAAASRWKK